MVMFVYLNKSKQKKVCVGECVVCAHTHMHWRGWGMAVEGGARGGTDVRRKKGGRKRGKKEKRRAKVDRNPER